MNKTKTLVIIIIAIRVLALGLLYNRQKTLEKDKRATEARLERVMQEKEAQEEKEKQLDLCLLRAQLNYSNFWERECEGLGRGEDCRLPRYNADRVDRIMKEAKDECYRRYKI